MNCLGCCFANLIKDKIKTKQYYNKKFICLKVKNNFSPKIKIENY